MCVCGCVCSLKEEFQGSAISESKSILEVVEHSFEAVQNWNIDIENKLDVLTEEEKVV